ncbi:MAG TPA: DUF3455 domain-containing protein [Polyangiaceae bacterium]
MLKQVRAAVIPPVIAVLAASLGSGCGSDDPSGSPSSAGSGGSGGQGGKSGGSSGTAGNVVSSGGAAGNETVDAAPEAASDSANDSAHDCGPTGPLTTPAVAAGLEAPQGSTLVARYYAKGSQIYSCAASASDAGVDGGTTYAWVFKAPEATLYDGTCAVLGSHYAGPTWKSSDGSAVVGSRVGSAPSPNANSIPLLLLKAVSNSGEGIFANVSAVQRLDTNGGVAPSDGCTASTINTEQKVSYTANYYFYAGGTFPTDAAAE